ncbi:MAG: hypothetical protein FWF28_01775 [Micrococcales bacterium]|nr:hypothetical protein [Micrococcales bacterium]
MKTLTPAQLAELETFGAAMADAAEAASTPTGAGHAPKDMPADVALRFAATRQAIAVRRANDELVAAVGRARAAGLSWHKIAVPLQMTAEGARKRFAHAGA